MTSGAADPDVPPTSCLISPRLIPLSYSMTILLSWNTALSHPKLSAATTAKEYFLLQQDICRSPRDLCDL